MKIDRAVDNIESRFELTALANIDITPIQIGRTIKINMFPDASDFKVL
ncbi:hypothetical protein KO494_09905 [Lacinutrix sp. C3R15]|nr:hypothetical protein [Lacinutrix sp. C3R15]